MSHKQFVSRLLQVRAHVILCFRAEEKIDIVKNPETGKIEVVPKRSLSGLDGWIPISEKTLPYELTLSLLLTADKPGVPKAIKLQAQHRTFIPLDQPLTEETGKRLGKWASGSVVPQEFQHETVALHDELVELVSELGATDSLPLIERKTEVGDKDWLARQIESARQTLAARATETEGASPQGGSEMTPSESPLSPEAPSAVDAEPSLAPDLDTVTIPDGEHKGLTLAEIVAKGPSGERWIRWALRHPDSKSVGPEVHAAIEAYTSQPELVEA